MSSRSSKDIFGCNFFVAVIVIVMRRVGTSFLCPGLLSLSLRQGRIVDKGTGY